MSRSRNCILMLEKCKNMKQLKQSHAQVITCGLENDNFLLSRLLAFCSYPSLGCLSHGWKAYQHIKHPTICIHNTMIKGFLLKGELIKTIQIYSNMLEKALSPDNYTIPYILKACASMQNDDLGKTIHGHSLQLGFVVDIFVGNTMIVMYSAFNDMKAARDLFDEIPLHTAVSWTVMISGYAKQGDIDTARAYFDGVVGVRDKGIWGSMISGYVQNNCFKEGLLLFRLMQLSGVEADEAMFVTALTACAHLGAPDLGTWIHKSLDQLEFPLSVHLGTSLVDMYARCGKLDMAWKVFDKMPQRDTICWNAMMLGLAMHGDGERALELFYEMEKVGVQPDDITFISIFTACSYSGMTYQVVELLDKMFTIYGIKPKSEHYGCVVDLLSRAGLLEDAKSIIRKIPDSSSPSDEAITWRALLSACYSFGEIQFAKVTAERLFQFESHSGVYVLLSNLYAGAGKHEEAGRMRKMMRKRGVNKAPGCSSIEINGAVHEFIAGEKTHQVEEVCLVLEKINKHFA